jgi:hypothetical protein
VSASVASQPYAGLVRLGALASTVSGALRIASTFIPYQSGSAGLETLYGVIDLGLMFGLIAVYLAHADRIGAAGLAAFAVAQAGIASIVGPDAVLFDIDFYRIGALTFVGGLALLSALMLQAGVMRVAAGLWLATLAASLTAAAWPPAFMAAGVLLGSGYVVAGVSLLRRRDPRVSPQPC